MDFGTIIGIVGGFAVVGVSIVFAKGILGLVPRLAVGAHHDRRLDRAMLVGHGLPKFLGQSEVDPPRPAHPRAGARSGSSPGLVAFSEKARREGLLALEDDLEELEDDFLRKGIQLVVDGTDPEIIKNILYTELNQMQTPARGRRQLLRRLGRPGAGFRHDRYPGRPDRHAAEHQRQVVARLRHGPRPDHQPVRRPDVLPRSSSRPSASCRIRTATRPGCGRS